MQLSLAEADGQPAQCKVSLAVVKRFPRWSGYQNVGMGQRWRGNGESLVYLRTLLPREFWVHARSIY